jgi:hypothetical protein
MDYEAKHRERYWDHSTRVIRWMGRNALRRLREMELAGEVFPEIEELAEWISEHSTQALSHFDYAKLWEMNVEAAQFALESYDPEYYVRAARGGSRSKRGATYTEAQLMAVDGLSLREQAEALGCSVATISRIRKRIKDTPTPEQIVLEEILEQIPQTTADIPMVWADEWEQERARRELRRVPFTRRWPETLPQVHVHTSRAMPVLTL